MKTVNQIGFSEIFKFAETKYGISWNDANDLFFNGPLQYGSVSDIYGGNDWIGYTTFWDTSDKKAADYTLEEVSALDDHDKAWLILGAFLNDRNIDAEVQVDCR